MTPVGAAEFAALMAPLGPFEPRPAVAVAVSGGADSLCLALLAARWAGSLGGTAVGLVVDHGLRPESAAEAHLTVARLGRMGLAAKLLPLEGLARGPGLADRARAARHAALEAECAERGVVHLLYAHHAGDQAETVVMRLRRGEGPGLAGMAGLAEDTRVRRLRPLLAIPPARLRATLRAAGLSWVEDPSNADTRAERNRLRILRGDRDGTGPVTRALVRSAGWRGAARAEAEAQDAGWLARHCALFPEGYALIDPSDPRPGALAALLRVIAGRGYRPRKAQLMRWTAAPRPATLGGVRVIAARSGRLAVLREGAAMAGPAECRPGMVWDGRFRVMAAPDGFTVGPLGSEAAGLRHLSALPAAVLHTLPALRRAGRLFAVPHLAYGNPAVLAAARLVFAPPVPAAGAPFRDLLFPGMIGGANALEAPHVGENPDAMAVRAQMRQTPAEGLAPGLLTKDASDQGLR